MKTKPSDFRGMSKRELRHRLAEATNGYFADLPFNEDMAKRLDLITFLISPSVAIEFKDYGDTREILIYKEDVK